MKLLLENWRQFIDEQTEPAQKRFQAQRRGANHELLDLGANLHKERGHTPRKRGTTVSAPPGALEEEVGENVTIVVFGPTGGGKSTYKKHFIGRGWNEIKTHTTRPPRNSEDDEYVFYERADWLQKDSEGAFINTNQYQGHHYGTAIEDFMQPGRTIMLSDVTSVEGLREFGDQNGKNMILLHAKSWTEDPAEMGASMTQRGTPERLDVWKQEMASHEEIPGAHSIANIEQAEQAVEEELS
jgi:guanylate kinase